MQTFLIQWKILVKTLDERLSFNTFYLINGLISGGAINLLKILSSFQTRKKNQTNIWFRINTKAWVQTWGFVCLNWFPLIFFSFHTISWSQPDWVNKRRWKTFLDTFYAVTAVVQSSCNLPNRKMNEWRKRKKSKCKTNRCALRYKSKSMCLSR